MQLVTTRVSFAVALALLTTVVACDRGSARTDATKSSSSPVSSSSPSSPSSPSSVSPGATFEGEVTTTDASRFYRKSKTLTYSFKGGAMRIDGLGDDDPSSFVVDAAQKSWLLMPRNKRAIGVELADVVAVVAGAGLADVKEMRAARTGKTEVVAGTTCEEWTMTNGKIHTNSCLTESITWFDQSGFADAYLKAPVASADKPDEFRAFVTHFPLRSVSYDASGEAARSIVTKVDPKRLDDARFTVPADYDKTDLGPLLGGVARLFKKS